MQKKYLYLIALFIFATLPYLPALDNEFVNFDDYNNIVNAKILDQPDALSRIWFHNDTYGPHPLTHTLWYIESKLFGRSHGAAPGFHGVSIILHAINAALVFILCRKLKLDISIAILTSALFAVHPWRVENVAWATSQKSLLSGIFAFTSWLLYLKDNKKSYFLSIFTYFLSIMAKATTIGLPFIFLLTSKYLLKSTKKISSIIPFFITAIAGGVITIIKEHYFGNINMNSQSLTPLEHLILAGRTTLYYPINFLFPPEATLFYQRWDLSPAIFTNRLYLILSTSMVVGVSIYVFRKKIKIDMLSFSIFGYLIFLAPVAGLYNMPYFGYTYVADKYMYMPLFFILIGSLTFLRSAWINNNISKKIGEHVWIVLPLLFVIFWSLKSWSSVDIWQNSTTLWEHVINKNKITGSPLATAHNNLGVILLREKGQPKEAAFHFKKALHIAPGYVSAHSNLGIAFYEQNLVNESIEQLSKVLKYWPKREYARKLLGLALLSKGEWKEAAKHFSLLLKQNSNNLEAHYNLALALAGSKKIDKAISHLQKVIELDPESPTVHSKMAELFINKGNIKEGILHLREASQIEPENVNTLNNLGLLLAETGNYDEAIKAFNQSLIINPKNAKTHNSIGIIMASNGSFEMAAKHLKEAIKLDPANKEARFNLQLLLKKIK